VGKLARMERVQGRVTRAGVLAVALLVVACGLVAAAELVDAQTQPTRVSMFGDSVMLGAHDQLLAQFAGLPVTVDAQQDRSLLGTITTLQNLHAGPGDVVVLDLGYNDMADASVFRGRIDGAMRALAGAGRVIWLNQHEFGPGRDGMNAELVAATTRYPNLDVADWNAQVVAHPEFVYGDGIHLTPPGQVAMATLVRQRYDQYLDSLKPTTTTSTTTTTTPPPVRSLAARPAAAAAPDHAGTPLLVAVAAGAIVVLGIAVALVVRRRQRRA